MAMSDLFLPELEHEMAGTRKLIERIPNDKLDWKAHSKSNSIGWVGSHLVEILGWTKGILEEDYLDIAPADGEPYQTEMFDNHEAMLEQFDRNLEEAKQAIAATSDEEFGKPWSLLQTGEALLTMPKAAVIRTWVLNHGIHHRAHLCVYLRLNDIPVPALYGPSGDEDAPL